MQYIEPIIQITRFEEIKCDNQITPSNQGYSVTMNYTTLMSEEKGRLVSGIMEYE